MIRKIHLDKYIKSRGLTRIWGNESSVAPLAPLLIMDAAGQVFSGEVKSSAKGELKRVAKGWQENYHLFNASFFSCWNSDETDEVIEAMDSYWEYVNNDIMILKIAVMERVGKEELEAQKVIAACMTSYILAQVAQKCWEACFVNYYGKPEKNMFLEKCKYAAKKYMNKFYFSPGKEDINFNEDIRTTRAVDALIGKTTNWLRENLQE